MEEQPFNSQSISTDADIEQLITLYKKVCTENAQLKKQLVDALEKNAQLTDKIGTAIDHLEKLLSSLPTNKNKTV